MTHPLRHLLFGLIAALLLLQPAVRAGAGCAPSLFTGTCPCTESEAAAGESAAPDCCSQPESAGPTSKSDQDERVPSKCGCEAESSPELPSTPRTASFDAGQPGLLEQIQVAFTVALPQLHVVRAVAAPRPPGRASDLVSARGPKTARRLAWLQVSLR